MGGDELLHSYEWWGKVLGVRGPVGGSMESSQEENGECSKLWACRALLLDDLHREGSHCQRLAPDLGGSLNDPSEFSLVMVLSVPEIGQEVSATVSSVQFNRHRRVVPWNDMNRADHEWVADVCAIRDVMTPWQKHPPRGRNGNLLLITGNGPGPGRAPDERAA